MHDGSFQTLGDVVGFYNQGGFNNPLLDSLIKPLSLSETEEEELVSFLRSLTGRHVNSIVDRALQEFVPNSVGVD